MIEVLNCRVERRLVSSERRLVILERRGRRLLCWSNVSVTRTVVCQSCRIRSIRSVGLRAVTTAARGGDRHQIIYVDGSGPSSASL